FGSAAIRAAAAAGKRRFGESYLQEALAKMSELQDLALEWHFIGPLQSNKTRQVAINFDWVHSVDRLKIAQRLNEARSGLPPLNICVQVNLGGEASKSGTTLAQLPDLAAAISLLPNLRLRGLMSIPPPTHDFSGQRQPFQQLREALEQLNRRGLALDTLSMGMSDDMEAAIAEGATLVRIGSAIFGTRQVV
ncbi:MAG: YggS family pyridoxal phosphate enzyme, partial [Gammaproteobacteria bacterium RBG_16_57_12]